jgi:hypothetical protein
MQYKNQISYKEAISMPQSKETAVKKPRKKPSAKEATSTLQGKETVVKKPTKKTSTKKTVAKKPTKKPLAKEKKIQEAIAKKAYELYEQSGRAGGRDVEHWLEAENLLKPKPRRKKTT